MCCLLLKLIQLFYLTLCYVSLMLHLYYYAFNIFNILKLVFCLLIVNNAICFLAVSCFFFIFHFLALTYLSLSFCLSLSLSFSFFHFLVLPFSLLLFLFLLLYFVFLRLLFLSFPFIH